MKFPVWLGIGAFGPVIVATTCTRPAQACLEVEGQPPVALPRCAGERAVVMLNRALRNGGPAQTLRIEMINDGHETDFALHGNRSCEGSVTSRAGQEYTGTWSFTRTDDATFKVRFSFRPAD